MEFRVNTKYASDLPSNLELILKVYMPAKWPIAMNYGNFNRISAFHCEIATERYGFEV